MPKRFRKGFLLFILLVNILLVLTACGKKEDIDVNNNLDDEYVAVETQEAMRDTIANTKRFNGKVIANEEVVIMPKVAGIVESVNVELGDRVSKDTVLFVLEQKDMTNGVNQAEVSINLAEKGVEQAQNALDTAMVNYELTKEKLDKAVIDLERTKELYEEGAVSKAQLEQAELAASPNQLEVAKKQITQGEISVKQSQEQLNQARISYQQTVDNIDNTVVRAPMNGIISALSVKKGQIAANGQAAATMVDIDKVYIQISVTEDIVNRLAIGQEVDTMIPSAFEGTRPSVVSYISPTADIGNKLYSVKVYIDNEDKKIRPGMNGEVNLKLDKIESVIVIKSNSVLDEDGENYVYIIEDDKAIRRPVTIGLDNGEWVEIKEGLEENEQVIIKGQHYVDDGGKVKVIRGE